MRRRSRSRMATKEFDGVWADRVACGGTGRPPLYLPHARQAGDCRIMGLGDVHGRGDAGRNSHLPRLRSIPASRPASGTPCHGGTGLAQSSRQGIAQHTRAAPDLKRHMSRQGKLGPRTASPGGPNGFFCRTLSCWLWCYCQCPFTPTTYGFQAPTAEAGVDSPRFRRGPAHCSTLPRLWPGPACNTDQADLGPCLQRSAGLRRR